MAYINEFPHTRNYDQDLGQLIKMYNELINVYGNFINQIDNKINQFIEQEFNNLMINAIYDPETETILLRKGVINNG